MGGFLLFEDYCKANMTFRRGYDYLALLEDGYNLSLSNSLQFLSARTLVAINLYFTRKHGKEATLKRKRQNACPQKGWHVVKVLEDQMIQEIFIDVIVKLMRLIQGNYLC